MSDYQSVQVVAVRGATIVLDVREVHPDMEAIHLLLDAKKRLSAKKQPQALVFAALLLGDYGGRDNALVSYLRERTDEEGETPHPREYLESVELRALEAIGESSNGPALYHATVAITVKDRAILKGFKAGKKRYGAAASGDGDWDEMLA